MGNNVVGSTKITYQTKGKIPVEYIYYDLKGKNRFPELPANLDNGTMVITQSISCSNSV